MMLGSSCSMIRISYLLEEEDNKKRERGWRQLFDGAGRCHDDDSWAASDLEAPHPCRSKRIDGIDLE